MNKQNQNTTERKVIRQEFKKIGYKVSFQRNSFNDNLVHLAFKDDSMLKPEKVLRGNCYSPEFYNAHKAAFELAGSFMGFYLTDTEQKIV